MIKHSMRCLMAVGILVAAGVPAAHAQQTGLTRTPLQQVDFPDKYATQSFLVTIAPKATVARHTHPGVEMAYVVAGEGILSVDGEPDREVKAGDSWAVPAGKPHGARNTGSKPMKLVATYVVEKDKPLATPAP
jgi:quercetin dioxygenase-like cupin family protein